MRRQPSAGANKIRSWITTATLSGHPMSGYMRSSKESMDDETNIEFRSNQHSIKILGL